VILVYDLTNPKSFEGLESWLSEIVVNSNEKVQIVFVGNKQDMSAGKELKLPDTFINYKKYIASAKTGFNVEKLFN
jgi:GTPase SAR1 family protein